MSALLLALVCGPALAARPDEGGGLFSFDEGDTVVFADGPAGRVRVHYSEDGPNVTRLDDEDGSGVPDFVESVALTAEAVLAFYADTGFEAPVAESELGLGLLGGSDALDFYLVDFGGSADGNFSVDGCIGNVCAGHMIIENDFKGYGYPDLDEAISVLTSHELFHAVQAATHAGQPVWLSEGTATQAEHLFDPTVDDFYWFCDAYLDDTSRSLDSPPAGVTTAWSYGTALYFQFMVERLGVQAVVDLQAELGGRADDEGVEAIQAVWAAHGADFEESWRTFVQWNLATGKRAGVAESYPFAGDLGGVLLEADGQVIQDDNRFYPLAATYFLVEHEGGPLWFATAEDETGVAFSLHPVADGGHDGPVDAPLLSWDVDGPVAFEIGDLTAGGYLLAGTQPRVAEQSVKLAFCVGPPDQVEDCLPEDTDTGDGGDGGDGGTGDGTGGGSGGDAGDGGGCATVSPAGAGALLCLLALGRRRDQRSAAGARWVPAKKLGLGSDSSTG